MLTEARPVLQEQHRALLTLANVWQRDEYKKVEKQVLTHLREVLKNDYLTVSVEVAEHREVHRAYTDEEKYKELVSKNPEIQRMKERMNLQLE